jgi:leucyl aminopeptidase
MLSSVEPKLDALLEGEILALGFVKKDTGTHAFIGNPTLLKEIETFFEITLLDELAFFTPTGKAGEIFEIPVLDSRTAIDRLYLVGAGDQSLASFRIAGAALGRKVRGKAIHLISLLTCEKREDASAMSAHAISMALGAYTWQLKSWQPKSSQPRSAQPRSAQLNTGDVDNEGAPEVPHLCVASEDLATLAQANSIAEGVYLARDLIHTPSNIKNPLWLADEARKIAAEKELSIKVLSGRELAKFGGLVAVGGSSPTPGPRFVEVSYIPKKLQKSKSNAATALPHVVIVGKGITFDTGGVSLKRPYESMIGMKSDMAGAASVLATISTIADLQPNIRLTVLLMCAENALSGTSQRPSDILTQYNGTTVEIINTDAEGRLVLADGLAYADSHLDPDYLLDIATLTGAATLGLGRQYAAMFTRDEKLAQQLSTAGEESGERVWHMPLIDDYADSLLSDVADLNHAAEKGDGSAGSVTAALYLEHFVGDRRWLHLDIAGPARSESDSGENPKGGTGFGVRLLVNWILSLS